MEECRLCCVRNSIDMYHTCIVLVISYTLDCSWDVGRTCRYPIDVFLIHASSCTYSFDAFLQPSSTMEKTLKRLMEHRWSGHLAAIDVISCNKTANCEALEGICDNGPAELNCSFSYWVIWVLGTNTHWQIFIHHCFRLLHLIEPVNKQLQADALDVPAATRMTNSWSSDNAK